jgi:hypothetical protein
MLVPGEYMLMPVAQGPIPQPQPEGDRQASTSAKPEPGEPEIEPPSFLLTLLRCLGVIHT